jgi:hypothetical protein
LDTVPPPGRARRLSDRDDDHNDHCEPTRRTPRDVHTRILPARARAPAGRIVGSFFAARSRPRVSHSRVGADRHDLSLVVCLRLLEWPRLCESLGRFAVGRRGRCARASAREDQRADDGPRVGARAVTVARSKRPPPSHSPRRSLSQRRSRRGGRSIKAPDRRPHTLPLPVAATSTAKSTSCASQRCCV